MGNFSMQNILDKCKIKLIESKSWLVKTKICCARACTRWFSWDVLGSWTLGSGLSEFAACIFAEFLKTLDRFILHNIIAVTGKSIQHNHIFRYAGAECCALGLGTSRALQHPNSHVSIIYFLVPSCSLLELYWKQNVFYLKVHTNIFLFPQYLDYW